ncbi:MAG: putative toxin, partial [Actinomycetota bacterium]
GRWSVERDPAGAMIAEQDPLGGRRTYVRDAAGRVTRRTDALGRVTDYTYDAAGRMLVTAYADGSRAETTFNADGLPATSSYRGTTITYTYDARHRVVTESYSNGRRIDTSYDALGGASSPGDRMRLVLSAGGQTKETVTYAYDRAHRPTGLTDGAGSTAYSYDALGRLVRSTLPNGSVSERTYDAASRLTRLVNRDAGGAAIGAQDFTLDAAGRLLRAAGTTPQAAATFDYTYDALDRLLREAGPRATVDYAYDANGNRLSRTDAAGTTAYTHDAANRLLSAGPVAYQYDANGNVVRRTHPAGATALEWDQEDRLVKITPPGGAAVSFVYDAAGRQISRTEGSSTTVDTYDGLRLLAGGPANLSGGTIFGGGLGSIETRRDLASGATVSFAADRLGGITDLTDAGGSPREAQRFDAFGFGGLGTGLDTGLLGFAGDSGAEREPSAQWLVRMGLRYYDTEAGRFISRDPLGLLAGDANLYSFVGNSPTNFTDSTGLFLDTILDIAFIAYDIYALATGGRDEFWINLAALGADVAGALIPFATGGGAAARVALNAGPDAARALGRSGELASGIAKNSEHIPIPNTDRYRIPDGLDHAGRTMQEVKNVGKLSYTQQLRDFVAYAKQNGYRMELIVDQGTKLTGPLEEAVRRGDIILKRKALR